MEIAKIVLSYIQTLLSWPVISAVVLIYFLRTYREPLTDFLSRIVKGQVYGVSLEASSPSEQRKEIKEGPKIETEDDAVKYIKENPTEAITEYRRVFNGYWFERAYNIIYGTQIKLLEHLASKGTDGEDYTNLFGFYSEYQSRSQVKSAQMADYIGFLTTMKFIETIGEGNHLQIKITAYGADFLSYIKSNYAETYKYKPY